MDPISDVLSLLKPSGYGFRGLDAGGDWALAFEASGGVKCYAVTAGTCWLSVGDMAKPVRLTDGDFVLLPGGKAMRLFSSPEVPPIDAMGFFQNVPIGESAVLNGGGSCAGVGGHFGFEGIGADRLLSTLPSLVRIEAEADKAALRQSIERLMRELREPQPGSCLIAMHLAQALLIDALRFQLQEHPGQGSGWLLAMADRRMHAVLCAMHGQPERKWTLAAFARIAGMSRSSFAVRFKETVGEPAMDYLTRWRMLVAARSSGAFEHADRGPGTDGRIPFGKRFRSRIQAGERLFSEAVCKKHDDQAAIIEAVYARMKDFRQDDSRSGCRGSGIACGHGPLCRVRLPAVADAVAWPGDTPTLGCSEWPNGALVP